MGRFASRSSLVAKVKVGEGMKKPTCCIRFHPFGFNVHDNFSAHISVLYSAWNFLQASSISGQSSRVTTDIQSPTLPLLFLNRGKNCGSLSLNRKSSLRRKLWPSRDILLTCPDTQHALCERKFGLDSVH